METKPVQKKISAVLWVIGGILAVMIVLSWFIDYPKWLEQLLSNILMIALGLVMLYKAWQIRNLDRKFSSVYALIGLILIIVTFLSFQFVKILAVIGLVIFLLTRPGVQKMINNPEHKSNS